jgi:DNA helicase HerA-like ATPase
MSKIDLNIKTSEHVFIAGSTGSGKTVIAKAYLSRKRNVVVLDTKGTFYFEPFLLEDDYVIITKLSELEKVSRRIDKIVYRPILEELNEEYYDLFFKWCYFRKNTIVLVDEAMQVVKNAFTIPEYYKGILTRGRELNVSVWSLTQRPSGLNQLILTESTHYFIFRLTHINDRKKISDISGQEDFLKIPHGYQFRYWKNGGFDTELGILKIKEEAIL